MTLVEVVGGEINLWCQKGSGRARHGSISTPIWVGGGVSFGPKPARNYKYKLPKKVRRLALRSALSTKVQEDNFIVLDELNFDAPKTKNVVSMLDALKVEDKTLIVTSKTNENVIRSAKDRKSTRLNSSNNINVSDLIAHD